MIFCLIFLIIIHVLLDIIVERIFSGYFDQYEVKKNSIVVVTYFSVLQFSQSLLIYLLNPCEYKYYWFLKKSYWLQICLNGSVLTTF